MKKPIILLVVAVFINLLTASAQSNNVPFEKFMDMKGVDVVYISESMLKLMPDIDVVDGLDISAIAGDLKSIIVINCEDKAICKEIKKEANQISKNSDYERIMYVKDDDEKVWVYSRKGTGTDKTQTSGMLMIVEDEDDDSPEITVIYIAGLLSINDIKNIVGENFDL